MRKKRNNYLFILIFLLVFIGIGFAVLSANVTINGSSKIINTDWDVHFENLNVVNGSVAVTSGYNAATINTTTGTDISFSVPLHIPGDYYEFTVDIVNDGKINAIIPSIEKKVNNEAITNLPSYAIFEVYDETRNTLGNYIPLEVGDTITIIVRVEYSFDISVSDLPTNEYDRNTFSVQLPAIQMDPTLYYHVNSLSHNIVELGASPSNIDYIINGDPFQETDTFFLRHFIANGIVYEGKLVVIVNGVAYYFSGDMDDYLENIDIIESNGGTCSEYFSYYDCYFGYYEIKVLIPGRYNNSLDGIEVIDGNKKCSINYTQDQRAQCDG